MLYTIWATTKNGDGNVQSIGEIDTDEMEDFELRIGMVARWTKDELISGCAGLQVVKIDEANHFGLHIFKKLSS